MLKHQCTRDIGQSLPFLYKLDHSFSGPILTVASLAFSRTQIPTGYEPGLIYLTGLPEIAYPPFCPHTSTIMSAGNVHDLAVLPKDRYRCKFGEIDKLNSSNFTQWVRNIRAFMPGEDCLRIVLQQEYEPPAEEYTRWKDFQARRGAAYALIFASSTPEIQEYISNMDDSADMWNQLHARLDSAASRAGRNMIARQFNQSKPEAGQPIQTYIAKLLHYRRCLAGTEQAISDEAFSSHLISTLPTTFNSFVDIVLHQPEGYTVENLIAKVVEAEVTLETRNKEQGSLNTSLTSGSTLFTAQRNPARESMQGNRFPSRIGQQHRYRAHQRGGTRQPELLTCWYCGVRGHRESKCRTKKRAAPFRGQRKNNGNRPTAEVSVTRVQALVVQSGMASCYQLWIVDSGATHHICHTKSSFQQLSRLSEPLSIILGDSSEVFGYESGKIKLNLTTTYSIEIQAIYIPGFSISLLSIGQLSTKYLVTFSGAFCYIIDRRPQSTCQPIELAVFNNGLYRIKARKTDPQDAKILTASSLPKISLDLWHQRFGHISIPSLHLVLGDQSPNSGNLSLVPTCEPCILGKQYQNILRTPVPAVSKLLELIHSDVCSPIAIPSFSSQKYFVLYIDDYSRKVWVYFVKNKDSLEMTSVFQEFLSRMEKAYPQWPITRFRCDNCRREYDNRLFHRILRVSGISFEPAAPYTQYKNGKSERMIQTLVTKACTILIDAKLPTAMWAEAIMTSAYLYKRSPSRPLGNKSPYEKLNEGKKPSIRHLRRVGCSTYKLIPPPQRTNQKFSERSRLFIMIGYVHDATTMWRLWDTVEHHMITASNVIFDERKIVGNASFENVLKGVLPEQVYSDEEEDDTGAQVPRAAQGLLPVVNGGLSQVNPIETNELPVQDSAQSKSLLEASRPECENLPDICREENLPNMCRDENLPLY